MSKKGIDISEKLGYRLMQGRLGIYDKYESHNTILTSDLKGVNNQEILVKNRGGSSQQQRMISDKKRALARALQFSYQGAEVRKIDSDAEPLRALINSNTVKQDYDEKIISIYYDYEFAVGDIFEWVGTDTYWLIYIQDLTELAYFRGNIRRCTHTVSWTDEKGTPRKSYAAIIGPSETKIDYIQKHGVSIDNPNYSITILLPKTDDAVKYFQRYQKFYLTDDKDYNICWRVEGADWLSTPGILEIHATEYYSNEDEDDVEKGIVGGLIEEPQNPNTDFIEETIKGDTFIKPKVQYIYTYEGPIEGFWTIGDKEAPVQLVQKGKTAKVRWQQTYSGEFDLYYAGVYKKTIIVESLF